MVRHELLTLNIKYMIPYCVLIPLPSIVIGIFAALGWQWPRTNEGWQITILNSGTFILDNKHLQSTAVEIRPKQSGSTVDRCEVQ